MSTLGDDLRCVYPPDLRVENVQSSFGDMWIRVETKTRVAMSPTVQDVVYYYYFNNKSFVSKQVYCSRAGRQSEKNTVDKI